MKPEQQRIKLAEWDGKCAHPKEFITAKEWEDGNDGGIDWSCSLCSKDPHCNPTPNYPEDLNAVHGLILKLDDSAKIKFNTALMDMFQAKRFGLHNALNATAAQRCEALLKTLGLWEEE